VSEARKEICWTKIIKKRKEPDTGHKQAKLLVEEVRGEDLGKRAHYKSGTGTFARKKTSTRKTEPKVWGIRGVARRGKENTNF